MVQLYEMTEIDLPDRPDLWQIALDFPALSYYNGGYINGARKSRSFKEVSPMKHTQIKQMVLAALYAALICVMTLAVQIPIPSTDGYINMGDCFCLLAAWTMPPLWGIAAAGIGSMLADLIAYPVYVPATLIIKAGLAALAVLIYRAMLRNRTESNRWRLAACVVSGIVAELFMVAGYFFFNALIRGKGWAAAPSIPGNLIQGAFGIIAATAVLQLLLRNPKLRARIDGKDPS